MADDTKRADTRADAEEKKEEKEEKRDDGAEVALDKLLKCVDDLGKRMDAWEEEEKKRGDSRKDGESEGAAFKAGGSKLDDDTKGRKDAKKDDELPEEFKEKEKGEEKEADKRRKDEDEKKEEEIRRDKKRKDDDDAKKADARADAVSIEHLKKQVADLQAKLPKQITDEDYRSMLDMQTKADEVYSAFGGGKRAPIPLQGEAPPGYRRRLLEGLQKHSPDWKDIPLSAIADAALAAPEARIYADAMHVARHPPDLPEGELREHNTVTAGGHRVTEFYGAPSAWMRQFQGNRRQVVGIRTKSA